MIGLAILLRLAHCIGACWCLSEREILCPFPCATVILARMGLPAPTAGGIKHPIAPKSADCCAGKLLVPTSHKLAPPLPAAILPLPHTCDNSQLYRTCTTGILQKQEKTYPARWGPYSTRLGQTQHSSPRYRSTHCSVGLNQKPQQIFLETYRKVTMINQVKTRSNMYEAVGFSFFYFFFYILLLSPNLSLTIKTF